MSIKGLVVDPITNYQANIIRIVRKTERRITDEILGVKGFKNDERIATIILPELFEHKKTP